MASKKVLRLIDDDDKGKVIRFTGGTYHGKYGWIDANFDEDDLRTKVHVIVFAKSVFSRRFQASVDKGFYTLVHRKNVVDHTDPTCWEEAVLCQDTKTEKLVNDLANRLATMGITSSSSRFFAILGNRLDRANHLYTGPIGWGVNYDGSDDPRVLEVEEEVLSMGQV